MRAVVLLVEVHHRLADVQALGLGGGAQGLQVACRRGEGGRGRVVVVSVLLCRWCAAAVPLMCHGCATDVPLMWARKPEQCAMFTSWEQEAACHRLAQHLLQQRASMTSKHATHPWLPSCSSHPSQPISHPPPSPPPVKNLAQGWLWLLLCFSSWKVRHASVLMFLPCSLSTALISRSTPSAEISGQMKN